MQEKNSFLLHIQFVSIKRINPTPSYSSSHFIPYVALQQNKIGTVAISETLLPGVSCFAATQESSDVLDTDRWEEVCTALIIPTLLFCKHQKSRLSEIMITLDTNLLRWILWGETIPWDLLGAWEKSLT